MLLLIKWCLSNAALFRPRRPNEPRRSMGDRDAIQAGTSRVASVLPSLIGYPIRVSSALSRCVRMSDARPVHTVVQGIIPCSRACCAQTSLNFFPMLVLVNAADIEGSSNLIFWLCHSAGCLLTPRVASDVMDVICQCMEVRSSTDESLSQLSQVSGCSFKMESTRRSSIFDVSLQCRRLPSNTKRRRSDQRYKYD